MALTWLNRWLRGKSSRRPLRKATRRHSARPRLEPLEDRIAPATRIWDGVTNGGVISPNANWRTAANWEGDVAPVAGDDLVFRAGALQSTNVNDFADGTTFNSLKFEGGYEPSGNRIVLGSGGIISTGFNVIQFDIELPANRTIDVQDGTLQIGKLPGTGSISSTPGVSSGFVKDGAGKLILGRDNSYTGPTQVTEGVLTIRSGGALGAVTVAAGGTTVEGGATLELQPNIVNFGLTVVETLTLNGSPSGSPATLRNLTGHNTWSGPVFLSNSAVVDVVSGPFVIFGTISNGASVGSLAKEGAGTLTLEGFSANTYTGGTTVNAGTLALNKSNAVPAGPLVIGDGSGTDTVLLLESNRIASPSAVTINPSGVLDINGFLQAISTLTMTGGLVNIGTTGQLRVSNSVTATSDSAGNSARIQGDFLQLRPPVGSIATVVTVNDGPAAVDLDLSARLIDMISPGVEFIKDGPGTLAFNGSPLGDGVNPNTHNRPTRVLDGTLQLNHANGVASIPLNLIIGDGTGAPGSARVVLFSNEQIPNAQTVTVNTDGEFDLNGNNETIASLVMTGGTVNTGAGTLTVTGGVTTNAAAGPAVVNGNLNLGGANREVNVADGAAATDLLINALVTNGSINKLGSGTLELTGDNTISAVDLDNGVLLVNGSQDDTDIFFTGEGRSVLGGVGTVEDVSFTPVPRPAGVISPGNPDGSPGELTVAGNLTMASNRTFKVQLNGLTAGIEHDQLSIDGTVALNNASLEVSLKGFTPVVGNQFVIISNSGTDQVSGRFAKANGVAIPLNDTFTVNGVTFKILYNSGSGGNDVILQVTKVVPNTPPLITNVSLTREIDEGGVAILSGQLVDPDRGDRLTLRVDWGDGKVQTFHPGRKPFAFKHRYQDDPSTAGVDEFFVQFTWSDNKGGSNSDTEPVLVRNVVPEVLIGADLELLQGSSLNRRVSFTDPGADSWTATVDFGDGSGAQPLQLGAKKRFRLQHQYEQVGTFTVTVTVTDDDGGVSTDSFLVTVSPRRGAVPR